MKRKKILKEEYRTLIKGKTHGGKKSQGKSKKNNKDERYHQKIETQK